GPFFQSSIPYIAGAGGVVVILVVKAAKIVKDFVTIRVVAQAFAQECFGVFDLAKFPQPECRYRVSLDFLWIQFGRKIQPGQNLAFVLALEMAVFGDQKMPAEAFDPISRRAEKIHLLFVLFGFRFAFFGGHVPAVFGSLALVKDRWVIAAMKRDIGL